MFAYLAIVVPTSLFVVGCVAGLVLAAYLLGGLIGSSPQYRIHGAQQMPPIDSAEFLNLLEALVDAKANRTGNFEILTNGPTFYPAALQAIREAQHSVCLEAYIFHESEIGRMYVEALAERARAGVEINLTIDAFGSVSTGRAFLRPLVEAGGRVRRYNRLTWDRILRFDHRTHRELLIVDGKIGFIGGAGIADPWYKGVKGEPRWRDTLVRVEGEAVPNLQATFAENWLADSGELLVGEAYFPPGSPRTGVDPWGDDIQCRNPATALVINSTPTSGGCTRARVLFQLLLASARRSIDITTPYFLPDKSLMRELCRAVERGVKVRILVPGRKSDHLLTRSTSRGGYGPLLEAGADVYEYHPSMIHAKILCVDHIWSVVGSTNFDNRSFGINDEVNLAVKDPAVALRLESDMANDLNHSRQISLADWRRRPVTERATELLGWVIARQQ